MQTMRGPTRRQRSMWDAVRRLSRSLKANALLTILALLAGLMGSYAVGVAHDLINYAWFGEGEGAGWGAAALAILFTLATAAIAASLAEQAVELLLVHNPASYRVEERPDVVILTVSILAPGIRIKDERAYAKTLSLDSACDSPRWAGHTGAPRFAWQQTVRMVRWMIGPNLANHPIMFRLVPSEASLSLVNDLAELLQDLIQRQHPNCSVVVNPSRPSRGDDVTILTAPPPRDESFLGLKDALSDELTAARLNAQALGRPAPRITIDITSGRKTWSAVAAVRALERGVTFSYVTEKNEIEMFDVDPARREIIVS